MRKYSIFYLQHDVLINNIIAWGIPAVFATMAIATGQIGYVASHYCGPTLGSGNALLWIPLLVYIGITSILQIWTLFEIEEVRYPRTLSSDWPLANKRLCAKQSIQLMDKVMSGRRLQSLRHSKMYSLLSIWAHKAKLRRHPAAVT